MVIRKRGEFHLLEHSGECTTFVVNEAESGILPRVLRKSFAAHQQDFDL